MKSESGKDDLLTISGLRIDGSSDGQWNRIVDGVDLVVKRGEVLGLVGESGAGKSTVGLAALGFIRGGCKVTGGSVRFDGIDMLKLSDAQAKSLRGVRVSYVAQSAAASFNPAYRIIDQVIESAVTRRLCTPEEAKRQAKELFAKLLLPDPENIGRRYPHQVSGGQLQRAMTAMAMLCKPDLIVFDEPTTALDVTTQVEVLAAVRNVVEQLGMAAIYISHDLAVVAQIAHRVMVLRHGKLVEQGPTSQMLDAPQEDYTKSLWAVRELSKEESPATDSVLTVKAMSFAYPGTSIKALEGIDMRVPKGSTLAVVGESGSGKTTLGRVIAGLNAPIEGKIVFDGRELPPTVAQRDRELLRRLQLIHQSADTALNPRHTVRQIIGRPLEFFFGMKGRERDLRVNELLERIELGPRYAERLPSELSGGQKQRINIARALAPKPDLIICDEITSALDQLVQEGILRLLLDLQKDLGVSYFFITHDISTVRAIADEVVVMHRGKIVAQGPKSQVFSAPYHPYTELLLKSAPQMRTDWLSEVLAERNAGKVPVPAS